MSSPERECKQRKREKRQADGKGGLHLGHAGQAGRRHVKSGIWFQSPSVFLCSTYTVTGEEITALVCVSLAERGCHVNGAAPAEVTPETMKNEWGECKNVQDEGQD